MTIPNDAAPEKILNKIIDITTDVFFNIPMTLTANLWSKYAPAFFYQFDYIGDAKGKGSNFLKPLPLVSKEHSKGFIAHGDELPYLFDAHDVFGKRIEGIEFESERDKEARKNLIKFIAKFAHLNESHSQMSLNGQVLGSFVADSTNFMKISNVIGVDTNFKFCQLSMLGAPFQAKQKISCEFLSENIKKVPLVPKANEIISGSGKKLGIF